MEMILHPHSESTGTVPERLTVEITRPAPDRVDVRYRLTGTLSDLILPPHRAPERQDGLWRTTCLELFVRPQGGEPYWEFNFSPSSCWAAYRFDRYRDGMRDADDVRSIALAVARSDDWLELTASVGLDSRSPLVVAPAWDIGPTAVIEQRGGRFGWWAIAHPPGKADFHDSHCFAAELRAAEGA